MEIPIEPTIVSFEIAKLYYDIKSLVANEYVEINAYLAEASGNRIKRMLLKMEQPTYNEWGDDDQFLIDWIKAQVCAPLLTPSPEPVPEPVPEPPIEEIVPPVETIVVGPDPTVDIPVLEEPTVIIE